MNKGEAMEIVVDTREKKNEAIIAYLTGQGYSLSYSALEAGDYMFTTEDGKVVLIERTTYSDFVGKIYSGRLWKQLRKLRELGDIVVFVLENPFKLRFVRGWKPPQLYGAIVALGESALVVTTRGAKDTAVVIDVLFKRYKGARKAYITKKKLARSVEEEALEVLMGIRGIGLTKAEALLGRFGSVRNVFNAELGDLSKVLGLKLAKHVKEVVERDVRKAEDDAEKRKKRKEAPKGLEVFGVRAGGEG